MDTTDRPRLDRHRDWQGSLPTSSALVWTARPNLGSFCQSHPSNDMSVGSTICDHQSGVSRMNALAGSRGLGSLCGQGAQGPFAPRKSPPFVTLQFRQIVGKLGVSFGLGVRLADQGRELRCPDFAGSAADRFPLPLLGARIPRRSGGRRHAIKPSPISGCRCRRRDRIRSRLPAHASGRCGGYLTASFGPGARAFFGVVAIGGDFSVGRHRSLSRLGSPVDDLGFTSFCEASTSLAPIPWRTSFSAFELGSVFSPGSGSVGGVSTLASCKGAGHTRMMFKVVPTNKPGVPLLG